MDVIFSAQNHQIKHLTKLIQQSKYRRVHKQSVLEGIHLIESYIHNGGLPTLVFIPEHRLANHEIQQIYQRLPEKKCIVVQRNILNKITSLTHADEITAIINLPTAPPLFQTGDCIALDCIQDPGNLGTILRSAAASGVSQILLSKGSVDVWSPKVLRAAMGAHFVLQICEHADLTEWIKCYRHKVYATALHHQSKNLYQLNLTEQQAWLLGNEGSGLPDSFIALAHCAVHIPMDTRIESLNIAMAATICLFEQQRQRQI